MPSELPVPRVRPNRKRTPGNDPRPLREVPMEIDGRPIEFATRGPFGSMIAAMISTRPHQESESVEEQMYQVGKIWDIIDNLDDDMQQLIGCLLQGMTLKEAAEEMDTTWNHVFGLLSRMRRRIREELENDNQ